MFSKKFISLNQTTVGLTDDIIKSINPYDPYVQELNRMSERAAKFERLYRPTIKPNSRVASAGRVRRKRRTAPCIKTINWGYETPNMPKAPQFEKYVVKRLSRTGKPYRTTTYNQKPVSKQRAINSAMIDSIQELIPQLIANGFGLRSIVETYNIKENAVGFSGKQRIYWDKRSIDRYINHASCSADGSILSKRSLASKGIWQRMSRDLRITFYRVSLDPERFVAPAIREMCGSLWGGYPWSFKMQMAMIKNEDYSFERNSRKRKIRYSTMPWRPDDQFSFDIERLSYVLAMVITGQPGNSSVVFDRIRYYRQVEVFNVLSGFDEIVKNGGKVSLSGLLSGFPAKESTFY